METEEIMTLSLESSVLKIWKDNNCLTVHKSEMKFPDAALGYSLLAIFGLLLLIGILTSFLAALAAISDVENRYALIGLAIFFLVLSSGPFYGMGTYSGSVFGYKRWIDFNGKKFKAGRFGSGMYSNFLDAEIRIIVQPLYTRGAWGSVFMIEKSGKLYELFSLGIEGSEAEARKQAAQIIAEIKNKFSFLDLSLDEDSWRKNREKG